MSKKPKVYLIGGAPRAGKTTLAHLLSQKLHLQPLSTDDIRAQIRRDTAPATEPNLFYLDSLNVDQENMTKLMSEHTQGIIAAADRESAVVWRAVESQIYASLTAGQDILIEGVAILPEFVAKLTVDYSVIHLGNQAPSHTKIVLHYARTHPDTWLGSLSENTLTAYAKFCQATSAHIEQEAKKYHQPYVEMSERPFKPALKEILQTLIP